MNEFIIASDSFKGTLSSKQIADLFEKEFKAIFSDAFLTKVILGDGGENTLEVFASNFPEGKYQTLFSSLKPCIKFYDITAIYPIFQNKNLANKGYNSYTLKKESIYEL